MSDETGRKNDQEAGNGAEIDVNAAIAVRAATEAWKNESADGQVYIISHADVDYHLIAPSRPVFKRFVDGAMKSSFDSMQQLLMDCLRSPDLSAFQRQVDKCPQLISILANAFTQALNLDVTASVKKA